MVKKIINEITSILYKTKPNEIDEHKLIYRTNIGIIEVEIRQKSVFVITDYFKFLTNDKFLYKKLSKYLYN